MSSVLSYQISAGELTQRPGLEKALARISSDHIYLGKDVSVALKLSTHRMSCCGERSLGSESGTGQNGTEEKTGSNDEV